MPDDMISSLSEKLTSSYTVLSIFLLKGLAYMLWAIYAELNINHDCTYTLLRRTYT